MDRHELAKKILVPRNLAVIVVVVLLSIVAIVFEPESVSPEETYRWYSILPPLLAVSLAIATSRVLASLLIAVIAGGLLASVPEAPGSPTAWFGGLSQGFRFVTTNLTDSFNLQLIAFIVLSLSMIAVVIIAGGLQGIVQWLARFSKGPRTAQLITAIMGLVIFIDDYANTMIVGTSMRPLTDRFRVSREKLAFLVDATSAPVAGLAIVSTWVGYEVGLFGEAATSLGIEANGYAMLFDALPFRFYCVLMLVFLFVNVISGKDFGPMARAQRRCRETGAVAEPDAVPMTSPTFSAAMPHETAVITPITALIPIIALFVFLMGGIFRDGGGGVRLQENPQSLLHFSAWRDTISASENAVAILAYSAGASLLIAIVCALVFSRVRPSIAGRAVLSGARSSLLPATILTLAWSLKSACDALGTGSFLVATVGDAVNPVWFPAIVFVIAGLTSFATGTSYGTMAILMPTAVPIAFALEGDTYGLITMVTLASILDGSILGDHCSPISDTTIMSSIASSSDHMHHVRTQLPYSLMVGGLALVCGYIPAGLGFPAWAGMGVATGLILCLFAFLPRTQPH